MPVTRMFGRSLRQDPPLASLALSIAAELSKRDQALIELVAYGDSPDHQEWITVRAHAHSTAEEERLADEFAKRITRFGVALV